MISLLAQVGGDPLLKGDIDATVVLIVALKVVFAFVLLLVAVMLMIWFERKLIADMQNRVGPNIAGPWGVLQTLADGIKLFFKEDLIPERSDPFVFRLAPLLAMVPAFVIFCVVPIGGVFEDGNNGVVELFGHETYLQVADPPIGILLVLAMSSIAVYGVMLAGWSSGSKYPLIGAVRATGQMISYEAALGLAGRDRRARQRHALHARHGRRAGPARRLEPRRHWRRAVRHLPHRRDGRAQPASVRSRRGRAGDRRRVPHGVLVDPVRALLPRGVHERRDDVGHHRHPVLRGPTRTAAVRARLDLAAALVLPEGARLRVHLRVVPGDAATPPLRPAHGPGMEGAHPARVRVAADHRPAALGP